MEAYIELRDKVDAQFNKLFEKHRSEMRCAEQCHACCAPDLSVMRVEADQIRAYLREDPRLIEQLAELERVNPHRGSRCALLNAEGRCSIYPVRPLICRSHGAPVLVQIDAKREGIDACELNFTEGMSMIEVNDWIHLETLNTLLTLIDWRYALDEGRERPDPELDRIKLTLAELLSDVGEEPEGIEPTELKEIEEVKEVNPT